MGNARTRRAALRNYGRGGPLAPFSGRRGPLMLSGLSGSVAPTALIRRFVPYLAATRDVGAMDEDLRHIAEHLRVRVTEGRDPLLILAVHLHVAHGRPNAASFRQEEQ